jgi:hypothetical protein
VFVKANDGADDGRAVDLERVVLRVQEETGALEFVEVEFIGNLNCLLSKFVIDGVALVTQLDGALKSVSSRN